MSGSCGSHLHGAEALVPVPLNFAAAENHLQVYQRAREGLARRKFL